MRFIHKMRCYLIYNFIIVLICWITVSAQRASLCIPKCPRCDRSRLVQCAPLNTCDEYIKEPGCGCCYTCALKEGDACGVYTSQCGSGMKCLGKNGKISISALIAGKGNCTKISPSGKNIVKDHKKTTSSRRRTKRITGLYRRELFRSRRHPSFETNGPCSRHLTNLVASCRDIPPFSWIPNCGEDGFYAPTQCTISMGLTQGECWCVNKNGDAMENTSYVRGDPECHRMNSIPSR